MTPVVLQVRIPPRHCDAQGITHAARPYEYFEDAFKAVLHKVIVKNLPPGTPNNPGGNMKDPAARREREMMAVRQRVEFDWRV